MSGSNNIEQLERLQDVYGVAGARPSSAQLSDDQFPSHPYICDVVGLWDPREESVEETPAKEPVKAQKPALTLSFLEQLVYVEDPEVVGRLARACMRGKELAIQHGAVHPVLARAYVEKGVHPDQVEAYGAAFVDFTVKKLPESRRPDPKNFANPVVVSLTGIPVARP